MAHMPGGYAEEAVVERGARRARFRPASIFRFAASFGLVYARPTTSQGPRRIKAARRCSCSARRGRPLAAVELGKLSVRA